MEKTEGEQCNKNPNLTNFQYLSFAPFVNPVRAILPEICVTNLNQTSKISQIQSYLWTHSTDFAHLQTSIDISDYNMGTRKAWVRFTQLILLTEGLFLFLICHIEATTQGLPPLREVLQT